LNPPCADAGARRYLQALETFGRRIGRPGGPDCLTCGARLARKILFGLILPARDDATRCVAIGLSEPCATGLRDRAAAQQAVLRALRRIAWPDLRPIAAPSGRAGRAVSSDIVAAAIACGLPVFPCRADKRPACPHGFQDAAPVGDARAIRALWRCFPGSLIGVPTGRASRLLVLDVDPAGQSWFFEGVKQGWFPATRVHRTRRGGYHVIFRHPARPALGNSAGKLMAGIDTRGSGGYVIWPPSPGYTVIDESEPAPLPRWIVNRLTRQLQGPSPRPRRGGDSEEAVDGLIRFVRESREGERNNRLFWAACRAAEAGDRGLGRALIAAACDCGLSDMEAQRTVASAWLHIGGQPA
jgi:Bifunctional DNA primase/polymerase, N-terminal